ncbi:MAG: hypothetical protein ACLPVJ_01335 [Syntrophobacteraceae bacterium]
MAENKLVNKFSEILGKENVFQDDADRLAYSYDAAVLDPCLPSIVLRPTTSEALGQAVRLCNENALSMISVRWPTAASSPNYP